jgi:hypothetical protein
MDPEWDLRRDGRKGAASSFSDSPDSVRDPHLLVIPQFLEHQLCGFSLWMQALAATRKVEKSIDQLNRKGLIAEWAG